MHSLDQHVNSLDLVLTFSLTPHLTWISWVHSLNTQMRGALLLFINVINRLWVGVLYSRIFSKEGALTYQRTLVYLMSVSITGFLEISRESVLTTLNKKKWTLTSCASVLGAFSLLSSCVTQHPGASGSLQVFCTARNPLSRMELGERHGLVLFNRVKK